MTLQPAVPFRELDNDAGWEPVPGSPPGIEQKVLSGALDEDAKAGVRTRLIRFQPGTIVPNVLLHDYWEELYLMSGVLVDGCDAQGAGGTKFRAPAYGCRPPGTEHGPFTSADGCVFLEIQYYLGGEHES